MSAKPLYTVIVADDEDELREAVCTMIPWQELGFCLVGNASNGLDALQLVEKLEPDLLLTDIRMPFISGIELARQVREVRPATNIAFLSGHDDFEYAKQAIQYNIISYMLKPLTMEGLGAELQNIRRKIDAQYAMFRRALEAIDQNYMDAGLSLVSISGMLDVSPNHLSACIKKYAGETFINILIRKRMEAARELLVSTPLRVQEVSRRCGYTDQHYFSYCFKKYSGESPNALRRRLEAERPGEAT